MQWILTKSSCYSPHMEFHFTLEFKISNQLILLFAHFRFYDIKYMVSQFIRKDLFMENYHVNRSCGRPYHATCGMAKAQMAARSSSCPCTEQNKNQSCACRMPNTVTINPEMYTHADHMEPAMAYVPCQQLTTTYDLCYALNVGTIFPQLCKPFCGKRGGRR